MPKVVLQILSLQSYMFSPVRKIGKNTCTHTHTQTNIYTSTHTNTAASITLSMHLRAVPNCSGDKDEWASELAHSPPTRTPTCHRSAWFSSEPVRLWRRVRGLAKRTYISFGSNSVTTRHCLDCASSQVRLCCDSHRAALIVADSSEKQAGRAAPAAVLRQTGKRTQRALSRAEHGLNSHIKYGNDHA